MERLQIDAIRNDLKKKMVFVAGPRQVGKTWLSKEIMRGYKYPTYLSYDFEKDRELILSMNWSDRTDLLIFDELHKMPEWKSYLKGLYDTIKVRQAKPVHILVTGSAGLDTYKFKGDSLAGRFFIHHLLPISPKEAKEDNQDYDIHKLLEAGGFPEPYLSETDDDISKWRKLYIEGILRYDIFSLETISDLNSFRLVFQMLQSRVGSPLSYNSIAEDVGISSHTVKRYVDILEALYVVFRIIPYSRNIPRSLKKEPKIYFYESGLVSDDGARIENFVAVNLMKQIVYTNDMKGDSKRLCYIRNKEKKEVDFCIIDRDNNLEQLIEVKTSDYNVDKNLAYFVEKYGFKGLQLVFKKGQARSYWNIEVKNIQQYFEEMEV